MGKVIFSILIILTIYTTFQLLLSSFGFGEVVLQSWSVVLGGVVAEHAGHADALSGHDAGAAGSR